MLQVVKIWSFGPLSFACNKQKSYRTICHPKLQNEEGIPVLQQWPRRAKVALLPPKIGRAPSGQSFRLLIQPLMILGNMWTRWSSYTPSVQPKTSRCLLRDLWCWWKGQHRLKFVPQTPQSCRILNKALRRFFPQWPLGKKRQGFRPMKSWPRHLQSTRSSRRTTKPTWALSIGSMWHSRT